MSFTLSQLFPGIETGLNHIGFLFGAGTSKDAGYPLMADLTKAVVSNLDASNKTVLEEIMAAKRVEYDEQSGDPNIEMLSDLVTECLVVTEETKYRTLESAIRALIVDIILSVTTPDLSDHIRFLEALKKRAHGASPTVTILTTNYDVLFEMAAGAVGIRMETGFDGPLRRVFDIAAFDLARGTIEKTRFSSRNELHVNLIKLHGSVAWTRDGDRIIESAQELHTASPERSMVLPRRRKVMDTLADPFDQLFTKASRILGSKCKFLVSCGFSFGDKHINDQLIFPKLETGQIRLTALCGQEPDCLNELKRFRPFHAGFPTNCFIDGNNTEAGTNLWNSRALTELIEP